MLYYILFWTLMGFIIHFCIIFGTNLLTGGPAQIVVFLPISMFCRKGISNGVQTEWNIWERDFWNKHDLEDLEWMPSNQRGGHEAGGRALPPHGSTDLLLPLIYVHIPWKHPRAPQNPISTAATFCTQEIPSWGLSGAPPKGALITEGLYINSMAPPWPLHWWILREVWYLMIVLRPGDSDIKVVLVE